MWEVLMEHQQVARSILLSSQLLRCKVQGNIDNGNKKVYTGHTSRRAIDVDCNYFWQARREGNDGDGYGHVASLALFLL